MKASFSMSSLRDGISQEQDESGGTPATLPRRKNVETIRFSSKRSISDKSQKRDEFWEALQPNYDYLMDDGLIASCKEANGELYWDDEYIQPRNVWTYEEFCSNYEELITWLEDLESKVTKCEGIQQDEIKLISSKIISLNDQSRNLILTRPIYAEEISMKTIALNRLWETVQHCLSPEDHHDEQSALKREIACQMRYLRKWVRGMEIQLRPIYRKSEWTIKDIEAKLTHHRVVQREVESREKNVSGVLKLCQRLEDLKKTEERRESLESVCGSECGVGSAPTNTVRSSRDRGSWFRRDFEHLQKRFHALWLRSLEWQLWLETLLGPDSHSLGSLREDASSSSSSSDEPNRKIPRLSAELAKNKGNHPLQYQSRARSDEHTANGNQENVDMVGMAGRVRPTDHHDVGYSSESSAHLSNEDGAREFVRIYTYTTAEATSPRVLEVVMDGDHRPRKSPPKEVAPKDEEAVSDDDDKNQTSVIQAGLNCGTFYFRHEDSDLERPSHRQRFPCRKQLNFSSKSSSDEDNSDEIQNENEEGENGELKDEINIESSDKNDTVKQWADGILKLVDGAEDLIKSSNHVPTIDSCDASGEYTSSNSDNSSSNDSDMESVTDRRGSIIYLKDRHLSNMNSVSTESFGIKQQTSVKLRSKKRKNGERPASVVEASQFNAELKYAPMFQSETALHRMKSTKKGSLDHRRFESHSSGRPKRSIRKYSNRKNSLEVECKCRSLGSLRHSSSSDNGRWKDMGSSVFPNSKEHLGEGIVTSFTRDEDYDNYGRKGNDTDASDEMNETCVIDGDLTLTQAPDNVSSASEQAWDDYLEAPYLSEPYSEQGVDDDTVRKLMEFGDDYQNFIGLHSSDGASTPSFYPTRDKMPHNKCGFDSESDIEDATDFLAKRKEMLNVTQLQLQKMVSGEFNNSHLEEVLASVQIYIKCLKAVLEQLPIPLHLSGLGQHNKERLRLEVEKLVMEANEQEERLTQLGQLQIEAKELEKRLADANSQIDLWTNKVCNEEDVIEDAKVETQKQLVSLEQLNPALINLNFKIHEYVVRWKLDISILKAQVHTLYKAYDKAKESFERTLTWLEVVGIAWNDYKVERNCLKSFLQEDKIVLNKLVKTVKCSDIVSAACSSKTFMASAGQISAMKERLMKADSQTSNSRITLANMTKAVSRLREVLSGKGEANICSKIESELEDSSKEIAQQESDCKRLLGQLTKMLEEKDLLNQLNINRSSGDLNSPKISDPVTKATVHGIKTESSSSESLTVKKCVKSKGESLIWRVLRAALPIQLAVVILFCFACLFEPHCCDTLNNFNLSMSPQLRYLDGPPPV